VPCPASRPTCHMELTPDSFHVSARLPKRPV
jgi:hypothetical protein